MAMKMTEEHSAVVVDSAHLFCYNKIQSVYIIDQERYYKMVLKVFRDPKAFDSVADLFWSRMHRRLSHGFFNLVMMLGLDGRRSSCLVLETITFSGLRCRRNICKFRTWVAYRLRIPCTFCALNYSVRHPTSFAPS